MLNMTRVNEKKKLNILVQLEKLLHPTLKKNWKISIGMLT